MALGLVILFWPDIRMGLNRVPIWLPWVMVIILGLGLLVWWRTRVHRDSGAVSDAKNTPDHGDEESRDLDAALKSIGKHLDSTLRGRLSLRARQTAPWYLLMGPLGSGKTRLLNAHARSMGEGSIPGQDLPASQQISPQAAVNIRLLQSAVWVETRGHIMEAADDQALWRRLLDHLRRQRSRRPLRGVIMTLSLPALLALEPPQRDARVGTLRRQLQELCGTLGQLPPVHVVLTHMDQMPGFTWLAPILADEDDGIWGFALDPRQDTLPQLDEALERLLEDLDRNRLKALDLGRDASRAGEILAFSHRMERAAGCLRDVLTRLCRPDPGQEIPPIVAVHLSGTSRTESPGDKDRTGLTLERILDDPVPPRATHRRALRGVVLQNLMLILSALLLMASLALPHPAKRTQADLMHASVSLIQDLNDAARDRDPAILASLVALHAHSQHLESPHGHAPLPFHPLPWWPGNQAMALDKGLAQVMNAVILPDAVTALEARIRERAQQWASLDPMQRELERPAHYEDLRLYLMIHQPAHRDAHILSQGLATLVRDHPPARGHPDQPDARTLEALWQRWLSHDLTPISTVHADLVAQVRGQLQTETSPRAIYARLQSRAARQLGTFPLDDILGPEGARLITADHPLPELYTAEAWQRFALPTIDELVEQALRGDWVTQEVTADSVRHPVDTETTKALTHDLRQRYLDDYHQAWRDFLAGLRVRQFRSLPVAADGIRQLSAESGTLTRLARWVHDHLHLDEPSAPLGALGKTLEGLPQGAEISMDSSVILVGGERHPASLMALFSPDEDHPVSALLNGHLESLRAVASDLESLAASVDPAREARVAAAGLLRGQGGRTPLQAAWVSTTALLADLPAADRTLLDNLLRSIVQEGWRALMQTAVTDLERQWQVQVRVPWQERLSGRFPFDTQGQDATLMDVVDFFHPEQGVLWGVVHEDLSPFIEHTRGSWRSRTWIGVGPAFSRGFIQSMERADEITRALFAQGQGTAELSFHLYPLPSPGLSEVVLQTNGQVYRYRNEPQEWRRFTWPGDASTPGARVRARDHQGAAIGEYREQGVWGLFRLLYVAQVVADDQEGHVYTTRWKLPDQGQGEPREIRFRIRPDRQQNFLRQQLFTGFQLPASPFGGGRG
ncbi:MAG: ImcF-related family protein [Pseudomonadota bacterium]